MNTHEEKIIIRDVTQNITTIQTLVSEISEGWKIKFPPTVIPAFAGRAPQIIYVLERD